MRRLVVLSVAAILAGCGAAPATSDAAARSPHGPPTIAIAAAPSDVDAELLEVARVHGGAGPWAVAGYRMGRYALEKLGLPRQSFDLEVAHQSPREVQFSCIADGAAAATGASLGKLNLSLTDADEAHVATVYRKKSTGQSLTLRPTAGFRARFQNVPREQLGEAGRVVISLPDAEVFEQVQ